MVSARHSLVAGEEDAVQRKGSHDAAARAAQQEPRLTRPGVAAVAVEAGRGVVKDRDGHDGAGVWGYTVVRSFCDVSDTQPMQGRAEGAGAYLLE